LAPSGRRFDSQRESGAAGQSPEELQVAGPPAVANYANLAAGPIGALLDRLAAKVARV